MSANFVPLSIGGPVHRNYMIQSSPDYTDNDYGVSLHIIGPTRSYADSYNTLSLNGVSGRRNSYRRYPYRKYWRSRIEDNDDPYDQASLLSAGTLPPSSTTYQPTTKQPLDVKYHLEGFAWALSLLDDDTSALVFSSNGKNVTLEVSKDSNPPKSSNGDEECSNHIHLEDKEDGSEVGAVCVYLTRCAAAADLVVDAYRTTYCTVNNRYAGVCCPRNQVDVKKA